MPESTEDGIKINYPKYDLSDNFLESVREVFGNIKIIKEKQMFFRRGKKDSLYGTE